MTWCTNKIDRITYTYTHGLSNLNRRRDVKGNIWNFWNVPAFTKILEKSSNFIQFLALFFRHLAPFTKISRILVKFIENKICLKNMIFKPISSTQHFLLQKNHLKFKIIVRLHRLLSLLCYVKQSQTKQMLNLINWPIKLNETASKIWCVEMMKIHVKICKNSWCDASFNRMKRIPRRIHTLHYFYRMSVELLRWTNFQRNYYSNQSDCKYFTLK